MATYGYVRVSTQHQKEARQIENISKAFPDASVYSETFTGTKLERPVFQKLLKMVQPGDVIVFDEVSRMARNAAEGFQLYETLFTKGIELVFLKEPHINTATYKNRMETRMETIKTGNQATDKLLETIMEALREYTLDLAKEQIRLAFEKAESEVNYLHQRTREGMKAAGACNGPDGQQGSISKARTGRTFETPKQKAAKEVVKKHSKRFGGTLSDTDCMKLAGVSRGTFYKLLKDMEDKLK